jgi:hypothetical protein
VTAKAEVTLVSGDRLRVAESAQTLESAILGAARGSIMELAWITDAETGQKIGINPEYVVMLRALDD